MTRGTTPTNVFTFPFALDTVSQMYISYAQGDSVVIEKTLDDAVLESEGNCISVMLSQSDTLAFENGDLRVQIRVILNDGTALASKAIHTFVKDILKGGEI